MLAIQSFFLILVVIEALNFSTAQTNYCRADLCSNGRTHIGCNNNGDYSTNCSADASIIPITENLKRNILLRHNRLRNRIARGNFAERFRPAVRMGTIKWGGELASLAELNVKQCAIRHDSCRNTKRFPYAGQNLARIRISGGSPTINTIAMRQINNWFNEYKDATRAMLQKYRPNGRKIGHFTQMIQEKATHVGCAILRESRNNSIVQYIACNYGYPNAIDRPVYRTGNRAGSQCRTGRNPQFKSLCSKREEYNVNVLRY